MGTLDDIGQKLKGQAQQIKGEFEDSTGNEGQGFWDKTKGKFNETIADLKLDAKNKDRDLD